MLRCGIEWRGLEVSDCLLRLLDAPSGVPSPQRPGNPETRAEPRITGQENLFAGVLGFTSPNRFLPRPCGKVN